MKLVSLFCVLIFAVCLLSACVQQTTNKERQEMMGLYGRNLRPLPEPSHQPLGQRPLPPEEPQQTRQEYEPFPPTFEVKRVNEIIPPLEHATLEIGRTTSLEAFQMLPNPDRHTQGFNRTNPYENYALYVFGCPQLLGSSIRRAKVTIIDSNGNQDTSIFGCNEKHSKLLIVFKNEGEKIIQEVIVDPILYIK
ncbi:MAG: hypothetical protein LBR22_11330 [Desulfovibrio sp.]|nr:hypothetical protein [Desulfovibrio sp.]